jgi:hypothetical protein
MTIKELDDDKEFVIASVSRNDMRELCGDKAADKLTEQDMQRLAEEMAELYVGWNFVTDLEETINNKFS